jgi:hypothetical protein
MAVGTRENNTMAEGCRKMLGVLTDMKLMPDVDDQFVQTMEAAIVGYLRNPTPQEQAQQQPPGGQMGQAMGAVMQPGAGGPPMGGGGGGMPMGATNPDELRRVLQQ